MASQKARRAKPKSKPQPPPTWWRGWPAWIVAHYAAGYAIAAVALGGLFLVTAIFGTVTNDDVAAAGTIGAFRGKGAGIFYYPHPSEMQGRVPAIFEISRTSGPRPVCGIVPEAEVVDSSSIRVSNAFGKTMQGVLAALEWSVGLFYDIKFPTSLEATAKEVRDPNFAQRMFDLQHPDLFKTADTALRDRNCDAMVSALLKKNTKVCPAFQFLRSPGGQELLAVRISTLCITLDTATAPSSVGDDDPPFLSGDAGRIGLLTKIKIQLGALHTEIAHNKSDR